MPGKISELTDSGTFDPGDEIEVRRGSANLALTQDTVETHFDTRYDARYRQYRNIPIPDAVRSAGWYDLVTWPAAPQPAGFSTKIGFVLRVSATRVMERFDASFLGAYGEEVGQIVVERREAFWPAGEEGVLLRLIHPTADGEGPVRAQIYINSSQSLEGVVFEEGTRDHPVGGEIGGFAQYTDTGNEVVLASIDMTRWINQNVNFAVNGAIQAESIGDSALNVWADWELGEFNIKNQDRTIFHAAPRGFRLNGGEYDAYPVTQSPPFGSNSTPPTLTETSSPRGESSYAVTPQGSWAVQQYLVNSVTYDCYRNTIAGTETWEIVVDGQGFTPGCVLSGTFTFVVNLQIAMIRHYQVVDISDDSVLGELIIPSNAVEGLYVMNWQAPVKTTFAAINIRLRVGPTNASNSIMMVNNYDYTLTYDEPGLGDGLAARIDSLQRGFMPPSIVPSSSINYEPGTMANNALTGNRPMWHDGDDWAYFNTTRPEFRSVDTGQFFFAESGAFAESGWTGSNHNRLVYTENFQGFPAVIRCTQSGGTITIQAPNNTQALWDTAKANGFRVDYRMMFGATFDGQVWMDIEPNNTSWGSTGRFEANVTVSTGQLQITMINAGGNTTFDIDRDVMHTVSMIQYAGSDIAEIHLEGVKIGEVTYGGTGSTERGTFFYIPPGNTVNDFSIQSITMYTLDAAALDVQLPRRALETGLRYNVPNVNQAMRFRVPRGLYDFGNTFTIVNGSTLSAVVSGEDNDHQLFGGLAEFEVAANTETIFTQAGFPRGNVWSVSNSTRTIVDHDDGLPSHQLTLSVASNGTVQKRFGTYTEDNVTVTQTSAGVYTIAVGTELIPDGTPITATANTSTGHTANADIALGEIVVRIRTDAGVLEYQPFTVSFAW